MQQASFCTRLADILQAQKAPSAAGQIVDAKDGLAAQWKDVALSEFGQEENADLQNEYWLQAQTWHLLAVLTEQRLSTNEATITPQKLVQQNPCVLPQKLVNCIIENDPQLREWIAIKQVLEHVNPLRPSTATGSTFRSAYLPDTSKEIDRLQRLHGTSDTAFAYDTATGTGVAMSLDLDSNLREKGVRGAGRWAGTDASRRENALSAVFDAVRRGRYEEAEEVCRKSGEAWRVAAIRGARFWGYDGSDDIAESEDAKLEGNLRRASTQERAVYGAISGDLDSVLPMCHTWDDHLWAHLNHHIITRLNTKLQEAKGYWYDRFEASRETSSALDVQDLEQTFERIERVQRDGVSAQAQDPYARIQQAIILGNEEDRVHAFADRLEALMEMDPSYAVLLTSFFAHFVLFRRLTGQEIDVDVANTVLQAYIDVLQGGQMDQLVAVYAAELREGTAEDSYAAFLRGMSRHASREERRMALLRAQQHGLNIRIIANAVIKPVVGVVQFKLRSIGSQQHSKRRTASAKEDFEEIIRSLQWLTFVEETYPDALNVANIVLCWMFNSNDLLAVRRLEESLPEDLIETCQARQRTFVEEDVMDQDMEQPHMANDAGIEQNIIELRFHTALRETLEALDEAEEQWGAGPAASLPNSLPSEQITWANERAAIIDSAYEGVVHLIRDSGWTSFTPSTSNESRNWGFDNVRQLYTGNLVLRIHELLVSSSSHIKSNLQRAIDLSTIVASEDSCVYDKMLLANPTTGTRPIEDYLQLVKDASMESLRLGQTDFWNVHQED
ncbi:hypothetical protein QFC20_001162 [Naganishia adeliensis]|uniref:Uncharacterized protein n=1 Tax=Naganishia adeliensis TaxID=92952 RepID=A0ACC2WVH3_9TREE|nr:hypothetical protein QFC20_001162 [Naganishia adeliensis]